MKPPFGTLNATIAKTIAKNAPKYRKIVEPFADGGTFALHVEKKPPKEHVVNIVDEILFMAFSFVQSMGGADKAKLKKFDWVGSQETFESVLAITATDGPEAFYRFMYLKKFGMQMDPEQPPAFDILSQGKDLTKVLYGLPMMQAMLKKATITNEDPLSLLSGDSNTFFILLPKSPEHVEALQGKINGLSGNFFLAYKVLDVMVAVDTAGKFSSMNVGAMKAASIMMATMAVVSNYKSSLKAFEPDGTMTM